MKKMLSFLSLILLLLSTVSPAFAYNDPSKPKNVISGTDNQNQCAGIISRSQDIIEISAYAYMFLQEEDMLAILEKDDSELIPKDVRIKHLTMIRQRNIDISEPIEYTFCTWNGEEQYLLLFFRERRGGDEYDSVFGPWELLAFDAGEFLDAEIPCSGQYALAKTW